MKQRRILSLILTLVMLTGAFSFTGMSASAAPTAASLFTPNVTLATLTDLGTATDFVVSVIVPAKNASGTDLGEGYGIDLNSEQLILPAGMKVEAYQVTTFKGDTEKVGKWVTPKANKNLTDKDAKGSYAALVKLLNKGGIIQIMTAGKLETEGTNKGKPAAGATVYTFAEILPRPKLGKYTISYAPTGADKFVATGSATDFDGAWAIVYVSKTDTKKNNTIATNLEYGVSTVAKPKVPEVWVNMAAAVAANKATVTDIGIRVLPLDKTDPAKPKQQKAIWFYREAAQKVTNEKGSFYVPASKLKKVTAKGISKAPKLKSPDVGSDKFDLKIKAGFAYIKNNDGVKIGDGAAIKVADKDNLVIWAAATAKKPASAKQELAIKPK